MRLKYIGVGIGYPIGNPTGHPTRPRIPRPDPTRPDPISITYVLEATSRSDVRTSDNYVPAPIVQLLNARAAPRLALVDAC